MTQDEIIEMARHAGFHEHDFPFKKFKFVAFAKLVAAKERAACFDAAYEEHATTVVLEAIRARGEITLRGEA